MKRKKANNPSNSDISRDMSAGPTGIGRDMGVPPMGIGRDMSAGPTGVGRDMGVSPMGIGRDMGVSPMSSTGILPVSDSCIAAEYRPRAARRRRRRDAGETHGRDAHVTPEANVMSKRHADNSGPQTRGYRLTETQKRRLRLRAAGFTFKQIAHLDGVSITSVVRAIERAQKSLVRLR